MNQQETFAGFFVAWIEITYYSGLI